jgi:hypothetical protein
MPEDTKAKQNGQNQRRFLHTKHKLAEEPLVNLILMVYELLDMETMTPEKKMKKRKKKKKMEEIHREADEQSGLARNPSVTRMSNGRDGRTQDRCIMRRASPVLTAGQDLWHDTAGHRSQLLANGWKRKTRTHHTNRSRRDFLGGRRSPKGLTISSKPI